PDPSFWRASPSASFRTPANTRRPRRSRSSAHAIPIPVDAPVTTTNRSIIEASSELNEPGQALAMVRRVAAKDLERLHPAQVQVHVVLPRVGDPAVDLNPLAGQVPQPVAAG